MELNKAFDKGNEYSDEGWTPVTNNAPMNRKQRRDYVRQLQTRNIRMHLVGFGQYRRHRESPEDGRTHGTTRPNVSLAPRSERRFDMIETYRAFRKSRLRGS